MSYCADLTGWLSRAAPHSDPSTFTPTLSSIAILLLRNSPVENEGFSLAVFTDRTVVTAAGDILVAAQADYDALIALGAKVNTLPDTGEFRNTWRVKQPVTSQPIDRLFIAQDSGGGLKETSVQGYKQGMRELVEPVGDIKELPGSLEELVGAALEGRAGFEIGSEGPAVQKVKAVVSDLL